MPAKGGGQDRAVKNLLGSPAVHNLPRQTAYPANAGGGGWAGASKTSETLRAGRPAEKSNAWRSNNSPVIIIA